MLIPQTRTEFLLSSVLDTKKTLVPQSLITRLINENSDFRTVNHVSKGSHSRETVVRNPNLHDIYVNTVLLMFIKRLKQPKYVLKNKLIKRNTHPQ